MSESTFTSFAVAGAGTIGSLIAEALLKHKDAGKIKEVFVLTRAVKVSIPPDCLNI